MRARTRDERGIALPSPVAALSLGAVLLAGIAFVATSGETEQPPQAAKPVTATPTPTSTPTKVAPEPVLEKKKKTRPKPEVRRGEVYVEVYNNSGISGLAGSTAAKISGAGWQVVGSDNWYGTIPQSTVYYPERLEAAAKMLARDLGVERLRPAISPMRFDRLTVILTGDFA
ncbi:MAG TPA: LytR C-terminal domain-containing protein [Nocardioidaceae bacterium]|nr:LytR C-terminal domain-containing protein [Nocardioidaceae bacterium]